MKKIISGIVLATLCLLFILGLTFGIHADVGNGSYYLWQLILVLPLLISLYSIYNRKKSLSLKCVVGGILLCTLMIVVLVFMERPLNSEVEMIYQNIKMLMFGYSVYLMGLYFIYSGISK